MRVKGKIFGVRTSKTLRQNAYTTQEYKLANLDCESEKIVDAIVKRHESKVQAT